MLTHPADGIGAIDTGEPPHGFSDGIPPSAGMNTHKARVREHVLPRFCRSALRLGAADDPAVGSTSVDQERVGEMPCFLVLARVVGGTGRADEVFPGLLRFDWERWENGS